MGGYKQPPKHSQFAKGKSGNPSGRPKGAKNNNSVAEFINTPVTVTLDGVTRKVPVDQAAVMALTNNALKGNTSAAKLLFGIIEKVQQKKVELEQNPLGSCPPISRFVLGGPNFDDCSRVLFKLGAMHAEGKNWRLETWVIEASFARNMHRDRLRNEEDYQEVAKSMGNPEDLPRLREKFG